MTKQPYDKLPEIVRAGMPEAAYNAYTPGESKADVTAQHLPSIRDNKGGIDLFSYLLSKKIIRLDGPVDDTMAAVFVSQLEYLQENAPGEEITVMINSPGGSVTAGLAMYDKMRDCPNPIKTVVSGIAASMGSILLCAGDKRLATKNARVMIHQPSGGGRGTATDTGTNQAVIDDMWDRLTDIYVAHSGTPHRFFDELLQSAEQSGVWLDGAKAMDLGLVDGTIGHRKPAPFDPAEIKQKDNYGGRKHFTERLKDVFANARAARWTNSPANDDAAAPKKPAQKKPGNGK